MSLSSTSQNMSVQHCASGAPQSVSLTGQKRKYGVAFSTVQLSYAVVAPTDAHWCPSSSMQAPTAAATGTPPTAPVDHCAEQQNSTTHQSQSTTCNRISALSLDVSTRILSYLDAVSLTRLHLAARGVVPDSATALPHCPQLTAASYSSIFAAILPVAKARCLALINPTLAPSSTMQAPSKHEMLTSVRPDSNSVDTYPQVSLAEMTYKRSDPRTWLEVLYDAEWCVELKRRASELHAALAASACDEKDKRVESGVASVHVLFENMCKLREKEDILSRTFPYRSLYHTRSTVGEEWEDKMGWRKQLVKWLRNIMLHFSLAPPIFADSVALADCFAVQYADKMGRSGLQLLYLTALTIAARVHKVSSEQIANIRALVPDYDMKDFLSMELQMVQVMGTTAGTEAEGADGNTTDATVDIRGSPDPLRLPREPATIVQRFCPVPRTPAMPDVQMVVMTAPFAFAAHATCFFSRTWGEAIACHVREALYVGMTYHDFQRYSPVTIAVASVYLGLKANDLWYTPTSVAWFDFVIRTLHVDVFSIRECACMMSERAGTSSSLRKHERNAREDLRQLWHLMADVEATPYSTYATLRWHGMLLSCPQRLTTTAEYKPLLDAMATLLPDAMLDDVSSGPPRSLRAPSPRDDVDDTYYEPWMGVPGEDGEIILSHDDDDRADSYTAVHRRRLRHKNRAE